MVGGTLALTSLWTVYRVTRQALHLHTERKRWKSLEEQNEGSVVTPEQLKTIFKDLPEGASMELPVYGFSMSLKSDLMTKKDYRQMIESASFSLPELIVENRFYDDPLFFTNKLTYCTEPERFGTNFWLNGEVDKKCKIEPTVTTELVGFNEVFTKRSFSLTERWSNNYDKSYSIDPWITSNLATSILFEGECVTAFGLVSYCTTTDSFKMSNPLAIFSGGIKDVISFFKDRASARMNSLLKWMGVSASIIFVSYISFFLMKRKAQ